MDGIAYKAAVSDAFNQSAATYDRLGVEFFTPMGRRLVELVAPRPGQRVLDVGCGRGACLFPVAAAVGDTGRVVGIDIAPAMIEETTADVDRQRLRNVELHVMDAENLTFPARSFDVVVGSYSIIFLPDAPAALARCATLLAPGGVIGFTSPVFTDDTFPFLPPVFTELIPRSVLDSLPPEHQPDQLRRRFNSWLTRVPDLERTMRDAGFAGVEVRDETIDMKADSGEAWVDWSHTQGMRLLWSSLQPAERSLLRQRLIAGLNALRGPDGRLTIETPIRYVTAAAAG